jgi:hypothetical protein
MRRHRRHISLSLSLSVPLGCSPLAASSRRAPCHLSFPPGGWAARALARTWVPSPSGRRGAGRSSVERPARHPARLDPSPFRAARGKQVKDAGSEVCFAHERGRTPIDQRSTSAADRPPELVRSPHNPWRAFEEVPPRAYFPRAGSVGPERRGPTDLGSRRSPIGGGC